MTGAAEAAPSGHRTVVGVDGSDGSVAALEWAVREARLHGGSVHAVMAWEYPQTYGANVWSLGVDPALDLQGELASACAEEAAKVAGKAAQGQEEVVVTSGVVEGHPALAILEAAKDADLLVVGSRGHGGFVGALLGSVSQHVVCHAPCPVVVVPDPHRRTSP